MIPSGPFSDEVMERTWQSALQHCRALGINPHELIRRAARNIEEYRHAPSKRPSFEELLKIYRDGRMEVDHQSSEDRDTRSLRHVLAAIPVGVTLPDDETLGRIALDGYCAHANDQKDDEVADRLPASVGAYIKARLGCR